LNRVFKLSATVLVTVVILAVTTWFFLRSSIIQNFDGMSGDILNEIQVLTDPISGQSRMGEYLSRSGKLIHHHLKVPVFPLIREQKKNDMDRVVIERLENFKKKLESMDGSATGSRVNVYHSVLRTYKEIFPGKKLPFDERLDITIRAIKEFEKRGQSLLEQAQEVSQHSESIAESKEIREMERPGAGKKEPVRKPDPGSGGKAMGTGTEPPVEEDRRILLSNAGGHIGERVYIYLKTGRKLEGFIKALSGRFLHLDIEFKGGVFSAKIIRDDIDEIIKVKENLIFKYLREEGSGR